MEGKRYLSVAILVMVALSLSLVGCQGTDGLKGDKGEQGLQGSQGLQGIQGLQGLQGLQGKQGDKGTKGDDGEKGDRGKTGESGWGGSGATGAQGEQGEQGEQGLQGSQGEQGIKGDDGISAPMLRLVQKDSSWDIINSETGGLLQYTLEGREFGYVFIGFGLEDVEYSLIYYADFVCDDKLAPGAPWGGNNPGAFIASGTPNSVGSLYLAGSIPLGFDLPHPDDANISTYDYSGEPDYYPNAHGAKIWLVPSKYYNESECRVTDWQPATFLFETDLIHYIYKSG